jgi:hypothetical protein
MTTAPSSTVSNFLFEEKTVTEARKRVWMLLMGISKQIYDSARERYRMKGLDTRPTNGEIFVSALNWGAYWQMEKNPMHAGKARSTREGIAERLVRDAYRAGPDWVAEQILMHLSKEWKVLERQNWVKNSLGDWVAPFTREWNEIRKEYCEKTSSGWRKNSDGKWVAPETPEWDEIAEKDRQRRDRYWRRRSANGKVLYKIV